MLDAENDCFPPVAAVMRSGIEGILGLPIDVFLRWSVCHHLMP